MSNHITHLLNAWHPLRDQHDWVLGIVYQTEGPCYRKPGAMMLFNSVGGWFGLLSGGCLEAELRHQAARVMHSGQAKLLCYDGSDEDDLSFRLGIGCGGKVHILLRAITRDNDYLQLHVLHKKLRQHQAVEYGLHIPTNPEAQAPKSLATVNTLKTTGLAGKACLQQREDGRWLVTPLRPPVHLLIAGGGVDAQPLVALADTLGWTVSLWDPRPANARAEHFPTAQQCLRGKPEDLAERPEIQYCDALVIMTHNLSLDAGAMANLQALPSLKYMALLGPAARKQQVLTMAGLDQSSLRVPLAGPAGLDLGGELPESIALAILAECHACLQGRGARSLSLSDITPDGQVVGGG